MISGCGSSRGELCGRLLRRVRDTRTIPHLRTALDAWFAEVRKARWRSTADVKRLYATASVVTAERIVFNIRGNSYRLVVSVDFEKSIVWIKWIGTHRDYDRIDVTKVDHEE